MLLELSWAGEPVVTRKRGMVMVAGSGVRSDGPLGNGVVPVAGGEVLGRVPVGLWVAAAIVALAASGWVVGQYRSL